MTIWNTKGLSWYHSPRVTVVHFDYPRTFLLNEIFFCLHFKNCWWWWWRETNDTRGIWGIQEQNCASAGKESAVCKFWRARRYRLQTHWAWDTVLLHAQVISSITDYVPILLCVLKHTNVKQMSFWPDTSSTRWTLRRSHPSDPSACRAGSEGVAVLHISIVLRLVATMFAAGANICPRITMKPLTAFAKNVGPKAAPHLIKSSTWECLRWLSILVLGVSCTGFQCTMTCGCGQPSSAHQTLVSEFMKQPRHWNKHQTEATMTFPWQVETKAEREARGRPVGQDVPYAAMGGLTGFSSLCDGYLSLGTSDSWQIHFKL